MFAGFWRDTHSRQCVNPLSIFNISSTKSVDKCNLLVKTDDLDTAAEVKGMPKDTHPRQCVNTLSIFKFLSTKAVDMCHLVKTSDIDVFGHVEGMLNRDIRTTKTLCISARTKNQCHRGSALAECRAAVPVSHVFLRKNKRFQHRRNCYAWNSFQRFKYILTFGIYLISIFNLPRSLSKPIMGEEWWISTTDSGNNSSSSKCNILKGMCVQARIAKYHGTNFLQHNLQSKDEVSIEFNPYFPVLNAEHKGYDEIDGSQFETMNLNEFVVKAYSALQKYAVGLEVMLEYQRAHAAEEVDVTEKDLKLQLKSLLYEIKDYINAFGIIPDPDARRSDWDNMKLDNTGFALYSRLLINHYVSTLNYVYAGLNYYNVTDCN